MEYLIVGYIKKFRVVTGNPEIDNLVKILNIFARYIWTLKRKQNLSKRKKNTFAMDGLLRFYSCLYHQWKEVEKQIMTIRDQQRWSKQLACGFPFERENPRNSTETMQQIVCLPMKLDYLRCMINIGKTYMRLPAEWFQKYRVCQVCWRKRPIKECSRCLKAFYCSVRCQQEDWSSGHRQQCQPAKA